MSWMRSRFSYGSDEMEKLLSDILSVFSSDVAIASVIVFAIVVVVILFSSWWRDKTHDGGW